MVDVKEAVRSARQYITNLYEYQLPDLRLEEVQLSDDRQKWLVTMGFTVSDPMPSSVAQTFMRQPGNHREYKVVEVDADTGEGLALKMRTLNT